MTRNRGDVAEIADRMEARKERLDAARRREARAVSAARPSLTGRPRGECVEIEIYEGGERITYLDRRTTATPIWGITSLDPHQLYAGVIYGATVEKLIGAHQSPLLQERVDCGGGRASSEDQALRLISRRDVADMAIGDGMALEPRYHTARPARGSAQLGPKRVARRVGAGEARQKPLSDRELVTGVCVAGLSVTKILKGWGWSPNGRNKSRAVDSLGAALTRVYDAWIDHDAEARCAFEETV